MTDSDENSVTVKKIREAEARAMEKLRRSPVESNAACLDPSVRDLIDEVNAIVKAWQALRDELGRDPSDAEVAKRSSVPIERVTRALMSAPPPIRITRE